MSKSINPAALAALLKAAGLDPAALASTVTVASAKAAPKPKAKAARTFDAGYIGETNSGHPALIFTDNRGREWRTPMDLVNAIRAFKG